MGFHLNLAAAGTASEPLGRTIDVNVDAIVWAQRMAIDLAEERQDLLGKGYAVVVTDDKGHEVHREHIDSANKHA